MAAELNSLIRFAMPGTMTQNSQMRLPATAERNWDVALNANTSFLDGIASIGCLLVTPTEVPSHSLGIRVTSGAFVRRDGNVVTYGGNPSYSLPPGSSLVLWLDESGTLSSGATYPATSHVRLASVSTGAGNVLQVRDDRVPFVACLAPDVNDPVTVLQSDTPPVARRLEPSANTTHGISRSTEDSLAEQESLGGLLNPVEPRANAGGADVVEIPEAMLRLKDEEQDLATLKAKVVALLELLGRYNLIKK